MGLVSLYFFNLGIFNDFFYWTVTFNLTTFAQMGRKYATFNEIIKVGFVFAPAFLYLIFNLKKQRQAFLLAVFVSGTLLFAYARFDLIHLQPVLPFIAIASALFVGKLLKPLRANLIIIYILIAIIPLFKHYGRLRGDTTRFLGQKENTLAAQIIDLTQDGDPILALATTPHIYKMTHTRPAGNIFVFNFPWFLVETDARIAAAIKNDPPKLVIRDKTATTSNINLYEYMPEIAKFVDQNYELAVKIETIEILLPKK